MTPAPFILVPFTRQLEVYSLHGRRGYQYLGVIFRFPPRYVSCSLMKLAEKVFPTPRPENTEAHQCRLN